MKSALVLVALVALCKGKPMETNSKMSTVYNSIVEEGGIPYQVSVQFGNGSHICSGVIVNENYILTAGHCVPSPSDDLKINPKIVTGVRDLKKSHTSYDVTEIIFHPKFNASRPCVHDIALVRVTPSINFSPAGKATLPAQCSTMDFKYGVTSGWRLVNTLDNSYSSLHHANISVSSNNYCKAVYSTKNIEINSHHICANDPDDKQKSCYTDVGSPLVIEGKVEGIACYVDTCSISPSLIVHTKVVDYIGWINSHLM